MTDSNFIGGLIGLVIIILIGAYLAIFGRVDRKR